MEFLTVEEIAKELKCSKFFVYGLIKDGKVEAVKIGKAFRVTKDSYSSYLHENTVKADKWT